MLTQRFKGLHTQIEAAITDHRDKRGQRYSTRDIVMTGIHLMLSKYGSRNEFQQEMQSYSSKENIQKWLEMRICSDQCLNTFLEELPIDQLATLKKQMVQKLLEDKVFSPYMFDGQYVVSIDGTGIYSTEEDLTKTAIKKTSKNGVESYQKQVLEAKLVGANGFSISLASAFINNDPSQKYDKQNCERKTFEQLAKDIKATYPRLPILLTLDGLYMTTRVRDICKENNWSYLIVQKKNGEKYLQEEIKLRADKKQVYTDSRSEKWEWITQLEDGVSWLSHTTAVDYFAWYTNKDLCAADSQHITSLSHTARLRSKIENEGFNTQKNHGYALEHLYNRTSDTAQQNYYQLIQIAEIINQLVCLLPSIKHRANKKITIRKLWQDMRAMLKLYRWQTIEAMLFPRNKRIMYRYQI